MTKTDLQNYRADKRRLDRISAQLAELETRVCVQSAADPPFSKHCVTLSGLPPSDEVTALHREKAALERRTAAVRAYISAIPDPQTREMFELRFVQGKKYHQIARLLGGMSEDCVRKRVCRYIANPPKNF